MKPSAAHITISTGRATIEKFLDEVILQPRLRILHWSRLTKQSPGLRLGYPAQYLASLLTGVEGMRSGARGDDLKDGTEVKSCNRIDQLDTCQNCQAKVLRMEAACSNCGEQTITRKNDSKWLLTIRSAGDLELQTSGIDRFLFILLDYPNFPAGDFDEARIQAFEIWPAHSPHFVQLLEDYYRNIYLSHLMSNPNKTPAPKNFWPESFQFYMCAPRKIFECRLSDFNGAAGSPIASVSHFVSPAADRAAIEPEPCPLSLLKDAEIEQLLKTDPSLGGLVSDVRQEDWADTRRGSKAGRVRMLKEIAAEVRAVPYSLIQGLALRDTSKAVARSTAYRRR